LTTVFHNGKTLTIKNKPAANIALPKLGLDIEQMSISPPTIIGSSGSFSI
jgi:hypothetical protein